MTDSPTTPATPEPPTKRGYRMPAEWEPHTATWLSWPRREGVSFPGRGAYDKAMPALAKMVSALADSEPVHINVCDAAHEADVKTILSRGEDIARHLPSDSDQRAMVSRPRPDLRHARRSSEAARARLGLQRVGLQVPAFR